MHRDCGLDGAADEEFAESLATDGSHPAWHLGAFENLEQTLRQGLDRLRSNPELIARDQIRGLIYDPEDDSVEEFDA